MLGPEQTGAGSGSWALARLVLTEGSWLVGRLQGFLLCP